MGINGEERKIPKRIIRPGATARGALAFSYALPCLKNVPFRRMQGALGRPDISCKEKKFHIA
jgi:hypothetical protein